MGKDSRRRRRKKARRIVGTSRGDGGERPTTIVDIPDDLLELVLLRVRTPLCLFRAAATCKLWRRVIAGDGFLHPFRSRHGHGSHLLLGHYSVNSTSEPGTINAEFVPSPPIRLRQRVSLDFLIQPDDERCTDRVLTDSRDGLLVFVCDNWSAVVCDPWTREYRELAFPWGQDDDPEDSNFCMYSCIGAFFLDAGNDDNNRSPMSSFRLLCACVVKDDYLFYWAESCVFSARDNRWVRESTHDRKECEYIFGGMDIYDRLVGRAGGSIFWAGENRVLVLSESTDKLSAFKLPLAPHGHRLYHTSYNLRVVASGGARAVHMVRLADGDVLQVLTARRRDHGDWECTVKSTASLAQLANIEVKPDQAWHFVETHTTGALVLSPSSTGDLIDVLPRHRDHDAAAGKQHDGIECPAGVPVRTAVAADNLVSTCMGCN